MKTFREIALGFAIIALLFSTTYFVASAADINLITPVGGLVTAFIPPTPVCPVSYSVVFDFASNTFMGLALLPSSHLYENYDPFTIGNFVLGSYTKTPLPCLSPIPIYPVLNLGTS